MAHDIICANLWWHKMRKKDAVGIVTLNLTCMTTNHIIILQWHIPEFMRKCLMLTFIRGQTTQNSWHRKSSLLNNGKLWWLSRRFHILFWGLGSGVSRIKRESWQHCKWQFPSPPSPPPAFQSLQVMNILSFNPLRPKSDLSQFSLNNVYINII